MGYSMEELDRFIVKAKMNTYAGDGKKIQPARLDSKDLEYSQGDFSYHDTYFGENDFSGQEVVYYKNRAIWSMVYFGKILKPEMITSPEAGMMIKESLTAMYCEGRFLGGFTYAKGDLVYTDSSTGDSAYFEGREEICRSGILVYELKYVGGIIL